jgi:hypothetical protein
MKIFQPIVTGSLSTSGSIFFPSLVTSSIAVNNVVMYGTSGQLFITSSNAIGGGSNTGSFTGSFIGSHTGSLFGTSSWTNNYNETDPIFVAKSASLATTGSNTFIGDQNIVGNVTVGTNSDGIVGGFQIYSPTQNDFGLWGNGDNGIAVYSTELTQYIYGAGNYTVGFPYGTPVHNFIGDQTITGSVYITGSLNADAQVYEVSFLQKDSPPYPFGDNLIELDQDLITNSNYTRNTNTITVNSSGAYKIYTQCRISVASGLTDEAELAVFINSNPYRTYYINNIKSSELSTYNFSCVANLNTSDTIEFHITSLAQPFALYTFSKIYTSIINSYMTIEKLN